MDSSVMLGFWSTLSSITSACRCSCASLACRTSLLGDYQKEKSEMALLPAENISLLALQPGLCMPVQLRQPGLWSCRHVKGATWTASGCRYQLGQQSGVGLRTAMQVAQCDHAAAGLWTDGTSD